MLHGNTKHFILITAAILLVKESGILG